MKHNKLILNVFLMTTLALAGLQAQEAVNAGGGDDSGTGGSISGSVGQLVFTSHTGTSGSVLEGVQQPYEILVISGIEQSDDMKLSYSVYPNPITDYLTLKIEGEIQTNFTASLYDISGRVLEHIKISSRETRISMSVHPSSNYFLKVNDDTREIKTFKIIKK